MSMLFYLLSHGWVAAECHEAVNVAKPRFCIVTEGEWKELEAA